MSPAKASFILVTPAYNDSTRLARFGEQLAKALAAWKIDLLWLISDDGSLPEEREAYERLAEDFRAHYPHVRCVGKGEHLGKGGAVYHGWDQMTNETHLAFVDADGAINCDTLRMLIDQAIENPDAAVLGLRRNTPTTTVRMSPFRWMTHYVYAAIVRCLVGISSRDPQCGVKIIPAGAYKKMRPSLHEEGMAFDAELLLRLQQAKVPVYEVPINWLDQPNGSFNPFAGMPQMLSALWKIRARRSEPL